MSTWSGKHGPLLIAEIGGNHEGDFEYARHLTQLACESGVDAVKFQIYTGDSLVNKNLDPVRHKHFKKFELPPNQYIELAKQCRENDVIFTASVWDPTAFEWIDEYIPFYKIGSGDLTAFPIIEGMLSYGKPILLSTGLSTMEEVDQAVNFIQSHDRIYLNPESLALLQCTSMYPIPMEDANLNVMEKYRSRFNVSVGYSDHTIGTVAVETAIAMGAEIIEFHFTDKREGKTFRDHQVSFTKDEVIQLLEKIDLIKRLKGDGIKKPLESEIRSGHVESFRRGLYFVRDVSKGTKIKKNDLIALRPCKGVEANQYQKILNKELNFDYKKLSIIEKKDLE